MFEIFRRRKRTQERPHAASTDSSPVERDAARQAPAPEPSTDAEDFHVPPEEVFQEEEQDGQGSSPRLRGE
jgi:hypothetical protein